MDVVRGKLCSEPLCFFFLGGGFDKKKSKEVNDIVERSSYEQASFGRV